MFCHWETGKAADAMIYEPGDLPGCCMGTCSSGPRVTGSTVIFVQGPLYLFLISRGLSLCARLTLDHMGSGPGIPVFSGSISSVRNTPGARKIKTEE